MKNKKLEKRVSISKEGKDGKCSAVFKYNTSEDNFGRYIGYCHYNWHRGIALNPSVCEKRNCPHYQKIYINKEVYKG